MLEIRGLAKRFGSRAVLRGIDLTVAPGRVTAVVGPNGAGKTTLIKSVLGLTHPDAGTVRVDGERAVGDSYRARIGYMPQIARFPENVSAADLIAMLIELRGVAAAERGLDFELISRFGLDAQMGQSLRTLSAGTRQKVNAVLAFLFRPSLLVLDEPTAGLDPIASGILKDRIATARDADHTIVLTSHVASELEEVADDIVFLLDGTVAFVGSVAELLQRTETSRLQRAMAAVLRGWPRGSNGSDMPMNGVQRDTRVVA